MSHVDLLIQIPLFSSLKLADRLKLAGMMRPLILKKGHVLFRKNDEGNALYIIIRGRIKVAYPSKLGDEVTLAIFNDGDFFGEMALLDGLPRSADAIAMEETQLYILSRNDFLSFMEHSADAMRAVLYALSLRLRKTDELLGETCFLSVSVRLAKRLVELAEKQKGHDHPDAAVRLKMTQTELASLLGVSRESINKELKILRQKNVLTTSRNAINIYNIELLRRRMK